MNNKFFIVFIHTYLTKLKSKSFIIPTIVSILLIMLVTNIDTILSKFDKDEIKTVLVLDETNEIYPLLSKQLNSGEEKIELHLFTGTDEEAIEEIEAGIVDGYLKIKLNTDGLPEGEFKAKVVTEKYWIGDIEQALQQIKIYIATKQLGLNPADVSKVYEPVKFEKEAISKGAKTEKELDEARGVVYILLFLIYFSVIFYGTMTATEVATEKSSRVMEILISSVSPITQMFGKILGIATLGLTQFSFIILAGYLGVKYKPEGEKGDINPFADFISLDNLPVSTIIYALVFFILGYLLYSTLLVMLGSLVSRVEEVNQIVSPIIILMIVGFFMAMTGLSNPNASFIYIASFIPFFTPMIMFLRVGMIEVPIWEVVLSISILIGTIVLFAILAAKIYRGGVLMYGKAASYKDLKKALLLSKKN